VAAAGAVDLPVAAVVAVASAALAAVVLAAAVPAEAGKKIIFKYSRIFTPAFIAGVLILC
jgi:hypothetical protein